MEDLSIEQHEAEIDKLSEQRRALSLEMAKHHDAMEAKLRAKPIVATGLDQAITPGTDFAQWMKSLPQAAIDFIRGSK